MFAGGIERRGEYGGGGIIAGTRACEGYDEEKELPDDEIAYERLSWMIEWSSKGVPCGHCVVLSYLL